MPELNFDFARICDELGPIKVVHWNDPVTRVRGMVVVDSVACGPSIGGVRMAPDVTTSEVFRLARAMTLKNAAAGLPHGGGKAGIVADPKDVNKEHFVRAFARAIRDLKEYIPGPDMGTNEESMAWVHDEIGRSLGLPRVLGGIPLDEIGATGFGLAECAQVAVEFCSLDLKGARVAVQGFGSVGQHAARFLVKHGARLVAVNDLDGTVFDAAGIDVEALSQLKRKTGRVASLPRGEKLSRDALFGVPCDILIPAARPDCIHADNARDIKAKLVLQGANIPATDDAERILYERGIVNVPDFIANAGGVICAALEYHGESETFAFDQIAAKIPRNTREILARSREEKITPREAAVRLALERVKTAMHYRRSG